MIILTDDTYRDRLLLDEDFNLDMCYEVALYIVDS